MIKNQIFVFLLRWLVSSSGMWLCMRWFGQIHTADVAWLFITAGLIFSLINSIVKPLLTLLALPLIIFSMGIFTIILNIAMVGLTIALLPGVDMGFGGAVLTTVIMSILNGLVNLLVPDYNK